MRAWNSKIFMRQVRIVTDSTADLPDSLVQELEIGVIYDYINFDTQSLKDKVEISRSEFYERLVDASTLPTTAAPGVGEFEEAYRRVGAPEAAVISLHPPAGFSVLYNTAYLAAQSFPERRVTVVDTGQISMGMGWLVLAAARAARAGWSVSEIVQLVTDMKRRARVLAVLDTFEFLRRSGRVNWTKALVGTLLRIKPMIEVRDSQLLPLDRVRTRRRAMERLIALTEALGPLEALAILHSNWPAGAADLQRRLVHLCTEDGKRLRRLPGATPGERLGLAELAPFPILTVDVTPIIGVHVGPYGLGIAAVVADPN